MDRFAVLKAVSFLLLAAIYIAGIIVAMAVTGDGDIAFLVAILGGFVVGGLSIGIGVID